MNLVVEILHYEVQGTYLQIALLLKLIAQEVMNADVP